MANLNKLHESCLDEKHKRRILIEQVRRVAIEIEFEGRGDTVVLAQELDRAGITTVYGDKWYYNDTYGGDRTNRLREFIKKYLPDLWPLGVKGNNQPVETAIEKSSGVNSNLKPTNLQLKIEAVKNVAKRIGFSGKDPKGCHYILLAALLDYLCIKPPQNGKHYRPSGKWLKTAGGGLSKLRSFIKSHIPELLEGETDIKLDCIEKAVHPKYANITLGTEKGDKPINMSGWTIRQDKNGYYRGYRRINGEVKSVYLGRSLDRAEQKLRAATAKYGQTVSA